MKFLYGVLVILVFACQESKQKPEDTPDAVRDLLVDRSFWTKNTVSKDSLINSHRFTITNTSHHYSYQNIEIQFDYYDSDHHKIESAKRVIDQSVEPRAAIKIEAMKAGLAKPSVTAATVTVLKATVSESSGN